MTRFEQAGRTIDRELEKLRRFFETEVKPTTQRRAVQVLRAASKRLTELARDLERRGPVRPSAKKK